MQIIYIPAKNKKTLSIDNGVNVQKFMGVMVGTLFITNGAGGWRDSKYSTYNILLELYKLYLLGCIPKDKADFKNIYLYCKSKRNNQR